MALELVVGAKYVSLRLDETSEPKVELDVWAAKAKSYAASLLQCGSRPGGELHSVLVACQLGDSGISVG